MRHYILPIIFLTSCATTPVLDLPSDVTGNYKLDPQHVSVIWSLSHAGLSNYTARFDDISGTLDFNADDPSQSRVDIRIQADSINTGIPEFDTKIANSDDGLDSIDHPEIRFVSTSINVTGEQTGTITGDLTLRGENRPVILDVIFNGAGKTVGKPGDTLGFSATTKIDRTDWGVSKWSNFGIGTNVTLRIETEFNEVQ